MGLHLSSSPRHERAYRDLMTFIDEGNALTLEEVLKIGLKYSRDRPSTANAFITVRAADAVCNRACLYAWPIDSPLVLQFKPRQQSSWKTPPRSSHLPRRERVLFIGTQFSILYTSVYPPAWAASFMTTSTPPWAAIISLNRFLGPWMITLPPRTQHSQSHKVLEQARGRRSLPHLRCTS